MAKYNVHAGHCPSGKGASGAVGFLNESDEARLVKKEVISELKEIGHKVYDCTCDEKETQNGCLNKIISKCNVHDVDLDISLHLNSGRNDKKGDGNTGGVEAYVFSKESEAYEIAKRVCKEISKELGIKNRGVKISTTLAVLRRTKNPAMLVECCFVDDKDDAECWDAKRCAKAIVKGILNKKEIENNSSPNASSKPSGSTNNGSDSGLKVDGYWGTKTTNSLQKIFKTTVDGVVSHQDKDYESENPGLDSGWDWEENPSGSSPLIKAIQRKLNKEIDAELKEDGYIGPKTIKAIQKWLGCEQDGVFSDPSPCIKKLQQWINDN